MSEVDVIGEGEISHDHLPDEATIAGWVGEVVEAGVRRPGYPADEWVEGWIADRLRALGLEDVRLEPVEVRRWEPTEWSLEVMAADGAATTIDCYPLPFAAPADGLDVELAAYDPAVPSRVAGMASLYDVTLLRLPGNMMATAGSLPDGTTATSRSLDVESTLAGEHVIPFGIEFQQVMEPSMAAGAAAFVGVLHEYPGDSCRYYVPYDAVDRPLPGVWISGTDGSRLRELLRAGPVRVRLTVRSEVRTVETHNVVGELPGPDDDVVIVGSHHDAPWASAVEDGSGIALVLAQATYWAALPAERRPHRMVFLLQGGHMADGAGLRRYIDDHRAELASVVLELHLEHAAREFAERTDRPGHELEPTGLATPRWWFTSRNPALEAAVLDALTLEQLDRSMLVAPDAFGDQPPTDGAFYHSEGVPIVNFLAAPFYLFDAMDTLDKLDRDSLVPLTRAAIRIVDSTRGVSAAAMRAGILATDPPPAP